MAVGLEEKSERKGGVALYFPANDDEPSPASSSTPLKLPRRLSRRLMESKAPSTAEEIEAKLRKADLRRQAKRQRAGYSMERRRTSDIVRANMKGMSRQDPAAIIARCWRSFVQTRKTTFALAKAFQALDITKESVKSMEFEQLASKINATATIQTVKALLVRLESRFSILRTTSGNKLSMEKVDHLLKRVGFHGRSSNQVNKTGRSQTIGFRKAAKVPSKLSRYPAKVVLFAYMILGHPQTVFIGKSEFENALLESASNFVQEFELLIKIILEGPLRTMHEEQYSTPSSIRSQLEIFDKRWCSYLHHFVVWKDKDAIFFEENMKGVARQLESFMAQTSKLRLEGDNSNIAHDTQVSEEQKILKEKLQQLGSSENSSSVAGSSSLELDFEYSPGFRPVENSKPEQPTSSSEMLVTENELVANEIVHDYHHFLTVSSNAPTEAENSLKAKLKKTMEKAFWDGIMESMEEDEPDFSWVIKVLKEVRDELCEMSPPSWRSEIAEKIDIEIVSQILNSGTPDVGYFKQLLDFSLVTLQKLSSPAKEKEMEASYQKLMEELGDVSCSGESSKRPFALLMVQGLRFILHQIQNLKEEIANAHLRMVEPLIKSPAGLEYLKSSFSKRCGSPADAPTSLPLTRQWLSSVWPNVELEWKEHTDSLASAISKNAGVQPENLPSTIRTGGSSLIPSKIISPTSGTSSHGKEQPECKGERLDLLIRLGLLKLVNQIKGLSSDTLPETLKLNLARLRTVQSRLQRIIVISTSLLVMRQILLNERLVSNPSEVDSILSTCAKRLCNLLDIVENVGILEIVEALGIVLVDCDSDPKKLQARKQIIANMLIKSLQEGDVVYNRVSRNIYLAMRGVVLGGSSRKGRQLAEASLLPIGAGSLTGKVVEAAESLIVMAVVSVIVHGDWYRELIKNW